MNTQMLVDEAIEALESQIDDTAIIACSGGIDSSVAAVLAHRAVGSLLHCVYVDTGFMRKGETEEVREMFEEMGIELQVVDASASRCYGTGKKGLLLVLKVCTNEGLGGAASDLRPCVCAACAHGARKP